jgi:hypothetical protein
MVMMTMSVVMVDTGNQRCGVPLTGLPIDASKSGMTTNWVVVGYTAVESCWIHGYTTQHAWDAHCCALWRLPT